jgi:hypothetical protein
LKRFDEDSAIYSEVLRAHYATERIGHLVLGDHAMMEFPPAMVGMTQFGGSNELKKDT